MGPTQHWALIADSQTLQLFAVEEAAHFQVPNETRLLLRFFPAYLEEFSPLTRKAISNHLRKLFIKVTNMATVDSTQVFPPWLHELFH